MRRAYADGPPPESVRRMMRLGTLYRFQAIVEGLQNTKPVDPLTNEELGAFEESLNRDGMRFDNYTVASLYTAFDNDISPDHLPGLHLFLHGNQF